jgi:hypothetical protein
MNKQWIYRNGDEPFSVTQIEMPNGEIFLTSVTKAGAIFHHNPPGDRVNYSVDYSFDLIPYEPYSDYKNGDKVYVHDGDNLPIAAYFRGLNASGDPLTYPNGTSPFTWRTLDGDMTPWDYCEKADKGDK